MHRSGIETALPTLAECDEMQHLQRSTLNAIERIRDIVVTQEHAMAEQRNREEANKARQSLYQEQNSMYNKEEGNGGFAGADPKKRRGRHAPPGRCHSCARSETPEWRRGPDGARTLCNACGLRMCFFSLFHPTFTDFHRLCQINEKAWSQSSSTQLKSPTKGQC